MKQVGFFARLLAVVAVLALAAAVVSGCGDDDKGGNSNGGDTAQGGSGGDTSSGGDKQYDQDEGLGEAKKVVVDSDKDFDAEQQEVIEKITEFGDATASKDYKALCNDILSKQAQNIGGDCVQTFSQTGKTLEDFKLTVKSVTIGKDGKTAKADVSVTSNVSPKPQSQQLSLAKEKGDWRIQILGQ